jgi:riboflavin transporter FmnP
MNTKTLALIIVFTALTLAINIAGPKIPAPYAPFLLYQLWEIPIVFVFLAIGIIPGLIVVGINTIVLLVYYPGAILLGPIYNLLAILAMILGVFIPYLLITHRHKENMQTALKQHATLLIVSATALGILLRLAITSFTNYVLIQQPPPVGLSYPAEAALAFLPLSALFNATVALYTIPVAIAITIAVASKIKLK